MNKPVNVNVSALACAIASFVDPDEGKRKAQLAAALKSANIDPETFSFRGPECRRAQSGRLYIADATVAIDGKTFVHESCRRWRRRGEGRWYPTFVSAIGVVLAVAQRSMTDHGASWLAANQVELSEEGLIEATRTERTLGRRTTQLGLGGLIYELFGARNQAGELISVEGAADDMLQHQLAIPAEHAEQVQAAYSLVRKAGRQTPTDEELIFLGNVSDAFDLRTLVADQHAAAQELEPGITLAALTQRTGGQATDGDVDDDDSDYGDEPEDDGVTEPTTLVVSAQE